ncbi:Asp23/Gls24 family envelope stress response protein [Oscillospiraceae bacterium MB08-C2-2]|nr:Asp23/Gls24 family envelope stress response protein [Oscillospiraceae bacterium MB08-C2-2]
MERRDQKQSTGSLKISQEVIATICSVAALEIDGVSSLAESPASLWGLLGSSNRNKSIQVSLSDDFAEINIHLNLDFGAKITQVGPAVQAAIKDSVQNMTGIAVSKVNVYVAGIVFPQSEESPAQQ